MSACRSTKAINMEVVLANAIGAITRLKGENDRLADALEKMSLKNRMLERQRDDAENEMCRLEDVVKKLHRTIALLEMKTNENTDPDFELEESDTQDLILGSTNCDDILVDSAEQDSILGYKMEEKGEGEEEEPFTMPDYDSSNTESLCGSLEDEAMNTPMEEWKSVYMHYRCIRFSEFEHERRDGYELWLEEPNLLEVFHPISIRFEEQNDYLIVHLLFQCDRDLSNATLKVYRNSGCHALTWNPYPFSTTKNITAARRSFFA